MTISTSADEIRMKSQEIDSTIGLPCLVAFCLL